MKKLLLLLTISTTILASCSKNDDDSQRRKFVSMKLDSGYEIGEDPKGVVTFSDQSTDNPTGFPTLVVSGFSYNKLFFTFSITSTTNALHTGVYTSAMSNNSLTMLDVNANVMEANVDQGQFTLNIISVQDSTVQGTFTATLVNDITGEIHTVSNGAFRTNFSLSN